MCSHDDVDAAVRQPLEHSLLLGSRSKPAEKLYTHWVFAHAFAEGLIVLLRQHGCWSQERRLLAAHDGLEDRPNGNFCLSKPDIPANEPIHWPLGFHILLRLRDGFNLVRGLLERKGVLEFSLPVRVRSERESRLQVAFSLHLQHA